MQASNSACCLILLVSCLALTFTDVRLQLLFEPEEGGDMFLRNIKLHGIATQKTVF
jgi:hypothetical protein